MQNPTNPYSRFKGQLILRDELALDRTVLANERTLLAYLRTAVALILAGFTFLHFAQATWFAVMGIVAVIVGLAVLPLAVHRYRRVQFGLNLLRQGMTYALPPAAVNDADRAGAAKDTLNS